jgi:hypothetical protein
VGTGAAGKPFTTAHRIETFAPGGGRGPDSHLHGLAADGWAKFDDFAGWAEPAADWSAVDVASSRFTVTGLGGVAFCYGRGEQLEDVAAPGSSAQGVHRARRGHRAPADTPDAQDRGRVFALLCPVALTLSQPR